MRYNGAIKLEHSIVAGTLLKLENISYELTGVLIHKGHSFTSGHYQTITRCCVSGNSFLCNDDNNPRKISTQELSNYINMAYMLVYQRKIESEDDLTTLENNIQGLGVDCQAGRVKTPPVHELGATKVSTDAQKCQEHVSETHEPQSSLLTELHKLENEKKIFNKKNQMIGQTMIKNC